MSREIEHNLVDKAIAAEGDGQTIMVSQKDLPMILTLELEDGTKKKYVLGFAKVAKGLVLSKA